MNTMESMRNSSRSGFTLLEVVVSVFVLTMVALVFATTIPAARKAAYMNGQYAQATSVCQHKLDELRAIGPGRMDTFQELVDAQVVDATPTSSPYSFTARDNLVNHLNDPAQDLRLPMATGRLTVAKNATYSDAMNATVTVTWYPSAHQPHTSTMTMSATITNQGL